MYVSIADELLTPYVCYCKERDLEPSLVDIEFAAAIK